MSDLTFTSAGKTPDAKYVLFFEYNGKNAAFLQAEGVVLIGPNSDALARALPGNEQVENDEGATAFDRHKEAIAALLPLQEVILDPGDGSADDGADPLDAGPAWGG